MLGGKWLLEVVLRVPRIDDQSVLQVVVCGQTLTVLVQRRLHVSSMDLMRRVEWGLGSETRDKGTWSACQKVSFWVLIEELELSDVFNEEIGNLRVLWCLQVNGPPSRSGPIFNRILPHRCGWPSQDTMPDFRSAVTILRWFEIKAALRGGTPDLLPRLLQILPHRLSCGRSFQLLSQIRYLI